MNNDHMSDLHNLDQSVYYFGLDIFHIGEMNSDDVHHHNLSHICYNHLGDYGYAVQHVDLL